MFNTNFCFTPGKLTVLLDAQAGSSGKGKLGSFVCANADNWQFACTTAFPQAGHWVKLGDGRSFFYQTFNSCAYQTERYEKLYIAPGGAIELPAFWREIAENNIPRHKIGISPLTSILQDIDSGYERGTHSLEGKLLYEVVHGGPLAATGTTAHGCTANRARRVLRRKEAKYARDIPELAEFICDVPAEIMDRLDNGQAGLLEIAQGFQLSYLLPEMFPYCTSRNVTVAAGLDDLMVAPRYAGNVILNFRTFPIRINSNKYIDTDTGTHLTWQEVMLRLPANISNHDFVVGNYDHKQLARTAGITVIKGNSGPGYHDQIETTWDEVTLQSGASEPIIELTSVTKLPRRVFTFSKQNVKDAIRHNDTGNLIILSVNFMNYVDAAMTSVSGTTYQPATILTCKAQSWLLNNIVTHLDQPYFGRKLNCNKPLIGLCFIGTGPLIDDQIVIQPIFD